METKFVDDNFTSIHYLNLASGIIIQKCHQDRNSVTKITFTVTQITKVLKSKSGRCILTGDLKYKICHWNFHLNLYLNS